MTMTAADPAAVFARLAELDDSTLATVTAAFGRTPSVSEVVPAEVERLERVIDAVLAGQQAATAAVEAAAAPELPDLPPPSVDPLRARVRALDDQARNVLLSVWAAQGLPGLANPDGSSVLLDVETHHRIERLIAGAEAPVDPSIAAELKARWHAMPPGPRLAVEARLAGQGIAECFANPLSFTAGRAATLGLFLDDVEAEAATIVAAQLGPVADGSVVTTIVDSAEAIAELPPDGKVGEVVAWVMEGPIPARARAALDAEQRRKSPRKSLTDKLAPLAGATPPPAPAQDVAPVGGDAPDGLPPAVGEATPPPPTGAPLEPELEQATDEPHLESELFRAQPVAEWGPLKRVAYLRRLSTELAVAATILEAEASAVQQ